MIRRDSGKVSDACVGIYRRTSDYLTNLFVSFSGILHENIDGSTMKARLIFSALYFTIESMLTLAVLEVLDPQPLLLFC